MFLREISDQLWSEILPGSCFMKSNESLQGTIKVIVLLRNKSFNAKPKYTHEKKAFLEFSRLELNFL